MSLAHEIPGPGPLWRLLRRPAADRIGAARRERTEPLPDPLRDAAFAACDGCTTDWGLVERAAHLGHQRLPG